MIAEDCSITRSGMARLDRLMSQVQSQVRQAHAMCNRVSDSLGVLSTAGEEDMEGGWRRYH